MSALLLFACGSGGSSSGGSSGGSGGGGTGSIAFSLEIQDDFAMNAQQLVAANPPEDGIDCEARDIEDIVAYVYDEEGIEIADGGPWPCTDHEGTIHDVPAKDFIKIVIMAIDKYSDDETYRGEKGSHDDPIAILPGKTTQVGKIILDPMYPPNAPSEFVATDGKFTDRIELSWQDVKHDDGYTIYRFVDDEWKELDKTSMDTTSYVVRNLQCTPYKEPPILYNYLVRAFNDAGESEDSETDSGHTMECPINSPIAPYDLQASDAEFRDHIYLTWKWNGDEPVDEFRIHRSENPEGPWGDPIAKPSPEKRDYEDTFPSCTPRDETPILYYYMITAYNSAGESEGSDSDGGHTNGCPLPVPDKPFDVNASDGEFSNQIELTWKWNGDESSLTGFRIYRSSEIAPDWDNFFYDQIDNPTRRSYTDDDLNCGGESWNYMVRAYNSEWESADSDSDSGETKICSPANVEATPGINEVSLSWGEVPGATGYKVYWTSSTGESETFDNITSPTYLHENVSTRRNYYTITAVNGSVESDKSEEVSAFPWLISTIDSNPDADDGWYSSIAISPKDESVHVSYFDRTNYNLKYAQKVNGKWGFAEPDAGEVEVGPTSLAIDSSGYAHISYERYAGDNYIYYVNNTSGEWIRRQVEDGSYAAIAVDSSGVAHFSYRSDGYLYYTNTEMMDNEGYPILLFSSLVQDTSIALDSKIKVHISFYDQEDRKLGYVTNASSDWMPELLDGLGDTAVGQYTSIALDSNDKVHISYYDQTNNGLKYATNIQGDWEIVPLDSTGPVDVGEVGIDTSIAVDSLRKAHISYFDAQQGHLKYATNMSGAWTWESVDFSLGERAFTSVAVDASDNVHISYYDGFRKNPKYATKAIR
jgi:hypothetical protein